MKKKFLIFILILLFVISIGSSKVFAGSLLFDWAFNINGETEPFVSPDDYSAPAPDQLPEELFDISGFDWTTGLGTITISYEYNSDITDDYLFIGFFDHEIDETENTYFNEYGTSHESLADGQSWEIDEPGYVLGDIYWNVLEGVLDNTNEVPEGSEDDVSMALGWNFSLADYQTAVVTLNLSDDAPVDMSYLYLSHTDPESEDYTIYYSSTLDITGEPPTGVPEPGTMILFGSLLLGIIGITNKKNFNI